MFETKKNPTSEKPTELDATGEKKQKDITFKVHTMPQKFQSSKTMGSFVKPQKAKSSNGKIVLIAVAAVVVIGLGVIGYLLLQGGDTNENANVASNENSNENASLNFPKSNTNTNTNTNTSTNTNTNINANANTNSSSNTNTVKTVTYDELSLTQDLDGDGLTDLEEDNYGTNKTVKDTDEDGFDDATELVYGYSPLSKGKLDGSAAVDPYTNIPFGFSVFYPAEWSSQARGTDGRGVLFFPDASTGEFIEISVQDNFGRLTPQQWYLNQTTGTTTGDLDSITNWDETQTAIISSDGFSTFYGFGNYIFSIYYETNNEEEVSYKTTYDMLRRSITFVTPVPTTNSNVSVNINTNTNTNTNTSNQNTNIDVTTNVP